MLATGPKQKLADHLNWWLDEVQRQRLRQSSYIRYRYAMDKHILPALGDIPLHKLTTQRIQSFYNGKQKENETSKERRKRRLRNRMVYNDWGLYGFVQMLTIRVSALWERTAYHR